MREYRRKEKRTKGKFLENMKRNKPQDDQRARVGREGRKEVNTCSVPGTVLIRKCFTKMTSGESPSNPGREVREK